MITLQVLNKIIQTGSFNLISNNGLTEEYFSLYAKEFNFIANHYEKYGKVPDKQTFLNKFPEFGLFEVSETDEYLLDALNEEHLYYKGAEVVTKAAELLKSNSNEAVDYLVSMIPQLTLAKGIGGVDIIKYANVRYEEYQNKQDTPDKGFIHTGFEELDNIIQGWQKGEEFVVLFARTGQGKSWILTKTCSEAWRNMYRVGYISPEMSASKIGYRFDTSVGNFSNSALVKGFDVPNYKTHIESLARQETPFVVATPQDFQRKITVSKLRTFCEVNKLEMLAIDGISYLRDERKERGDNRSTALTNISEDLMALSNELKIPILVVAQSNREGAKEDASPEIENIRDSDGIGYNASKIIALKQNAGALDVIIKKYRDGEAGGKLTYYWDIDRGNFNYIPSRDDANTKSDREQKTKEIKNGFNDKTGVF